jgi:starch synthase
MERRTVIQVLSVTSECVPFVKTGGLADVAGALPTALAEQDVRVRTLLPGYPAVMKSLVQAAPVLRFDTVFGGPARVLEATCGGLDVLVLDAPHLFDRPGNIYLGPNGADWPDNAERFAALSWVAAQIGLKGARTWRPDVLHCHDWQAGLAPEYLRAAGSALPCVMTVHNIAFQGLTPALNPARLKLDPDRFSADAYEFYGKVSALKAGLMAADWLTTVSPSYAAELMTPEFGMGLDGVLRHRANRLRGILNGIDTAVWDPSTDPEIKTFKSLRGKAHTKAALRTEFGLPVSAGPLCVVVSRLTEQKGLDLLLEALPNLLNRGGQLIVLGSGDPKLEAGFRAAANHSQVAVHIGYDEAMSHRLIAGGDAILVPSRFEPCGLTQLYGLRYGTLPLVGLTGGLADTVINASPAALDRGVATGIQFHPVADTALRTALDHLCDLWSQPDVWRKMVRNAQKQPVGWDRSAAAYAELYREALTS